MGNIPPLILNLATITCGLAFLFSAIIDCRAMGKARVFWAVVGVLAVLRGVL